MSDISLRRFGSLAEYFKLAEQSIEKLEYRGEPGFPLRGEIVAMAGGLPQHNLIIGNIGGALWYRLRGKPSGLPALGASVGVA